MNKFTLVMLPILLAGCAAVLWDNSALFSREWLFCSDRVSQEANTAGFHSAAVHSGHRDCSRKLGNGSCTDSKSNRFNYCFGPANTYSLEACQFIAKSSKDIAGLQYVRDGEDAYCLLLLDESAPSGNNEREITPSCPEKFSFHRESENSGGYGQIAGIDSVGQCYSCSGNDYCTTKIGHGECVDADSNCFNYCFATGYTLQQCQKIASKNKHIIGIEHGSFEDTSYCFILFDELTNAKLDFNLLCPYDFIMDESSVFHRGKGLIQDAVATRGYECYACEGDEDHNASPSSHTAAVRNSHETATSVLRE